MTQIPLPVPDDPYAVDWHRPSWNFDIPDEIGDVLVDVRPNGVQRDYPLPLVWKTAQAFRIDAGSAEAGWDLDGMHLVHAPDHRNQPMETRAGSGFLRFTYPDGYRIVVAANKESGGPGFPVGTFAGLLPSLRPVLLNARAERDPESVGAVSFVGMEHATSRWTYDLATFRAAISDPHAWLGSLSNGDITPVEAKTLLGWSLSGFSRQDAERGRASRFSPQTMRQWLHPRPDFKHAPFTMDEALEWAAALQMSQTKDSSWPDVWRRAGFTAAAAGEVRADGWWIARSEVRHWAKITDVDLKVAYIRAGFRAAEAAAMETSDPQDRPSAEQLLVLAALRS